MIKEGNFRKGLVFTILIVLLGTIIMSMASSLSVEKTSSNKTSIELKKSNGPAPEINQKNLISTAGKANNLDNIDKYMSSVRGTTMYADVIYASNLTLGPCYFDVTNPGAITKLSDVDIFLSGGTWTYDERWLCCQYGTGFIFQVTTDTGDLTFVGGGGNNLNALAYNGETNTMWGAGDTNLFQIDLETGAQTVVAPFSGNGGNIIIGMAFDSAGTLYGWDVKFNGSSYLYKIDTVTAECTQVGDFGVTLCYAQDGDFDRDNGDILYLTAFEISPNYGGYLLSYDMSSGTLTTIGAFQGSAELDASMIQYCWCVDHDVGVKDIISPNNGYANQDMNVIVKVRNWGMYAEKNVSINVVILKDGIEEEYNETKYVDICFGETVDVEMPKWTPDDWHNTSNEYINYSTAAHVYLYGDEDPYNDNMEKWFELYFGYFHDVGCTNVSKPKSGPAQTFPVNVTIKNFGQYDECCFKTYVEITELDIENQVELLSQNFSYYIWPPNGWTVTNSKWQLVNSSYAGGTPPEARFQWNPAETGLFRLYTPAIDTSEYSAVEIEFKHSINHYGGPYTLKVETSSDGVSWSTVWEIVNPSGSQGSTPVTIVTSDNVGSDTFYVSWTFEGNSYNINYWWVDDIVIKGYTSFDPEYSDFINISEIHVGQEITITFANWTPAYLIENTSGTKMYSVKAWTDLNDPQEENPDNDLFEKTIELDYFHDVDIKNIISPPPQRSLCAHQHWWYALNCSGDLVRWYQETGLMEYITSIGIDFSQGCTLVGDILWFCDTNGNIWTINPLTVEYTCIGNAGTGELMGLSYHEKSKVLYGCTSQNLFTINMNTGKATYVGPFNQLGYYMISIDCDKNGTMYGYDLNYDQSRTYKIDLTTGHATPLGFTGLSLMYGQDMDYDYDHGKMYVTAFNYDTQQEELYEINLETGHFNHISTFQDICLSAFAIPYTIPGRYVPLGFQDIEVIVENNGTFPESDLTCYAEIYEFINNCTNETLVYEDNITDIDLDEPLGGTEMLNFSSYNFATEGLYSLFLSIPDDDDDYPINNDVSLGIGADGTPPTSIHTLTPATPDGDNSWYISDITVKVSAADPIIGCNMDGSGVKEIKYTISNGASGSIPGDTGIFKIHNDGTNIEVKYWAVDNVGNTESKHTFYINMDQTKPNVPEGIAYSYEKVGGYWYITFNVICTDATSLMDRVEWSVNDVVQNITTGQGPTYTWTIQWSSLLHSSSITFKATAYDKAGNSDFVKIKGSDVNAQSYPYQQCQQFQQTLNKQNPLGNLLLKQMVKTTRTNK